MIHVTICQNKKGEYLGFDAKGHAGYAEAGDDIVCAAASILMINTANALELYADAGLIVSGNEDLFKTMVLGLTQMEDDENYAGYIDLTFEEVQQP